MEKRTLELISLDADEMVSVARRLRSLSANLEPPDPDCCPYTGSSTAITAHAMAVMARRVDRIVTGMERLSADLLATCRDHESTDELVGSRLRELEPAPLPSGPRAFAGGRP